MQIESMPDDMGNQLLTDTGQYSSVSKLNRVAAGKVVAQPTKDDENNDDDSDEHSSADDEEDDDIVDLQQETDKFNPTVDVASSALQEDDPTAIVEDHLLHVVIFAPEFVIDEGSDGVESVFMDGSGSHTHEPGARLTKYSWTVGNKKVASKTQFYFKMTKQRQTICLEITDNFGKTLKDCTLLKMVKPCALPGTEVEYFEGTTGFGTTTGQPTTTEFRREVGISGQPALIPPFTVRFKGFLNPGRDVRSLRLSRDLEYKFRIDGRLRTLPATNIGAGGHDVDLRVKVKTFDDIPFGLVRNGGKNFNSKWLVFDSTALGCENPGLPAAKRPQTVTINQLTPANGGSKGGTEVKLTTNKFNSEGTQLLFDGKVIEDAKFMVGHVMFVTPPHKPGPVNVQLKKGEVLSNIKQYNFLNAENPTFKIKTLAKGEFSVVEYCYNYIFTAEYDKPNSSKSGIIKQWKIQDGYKLQLQKTIQTVAKQAKDGSNSVLGLACDPFMSDDNFDIYVHHSTLFQTNAFGIWPIPPSNFVKYLGFVSKLNSKEGFGKLKPIISGLPVSNRDHAVNGGIFKDDGTLIIAVGGMTNQGVPGPNMGGLPESPLSGAILEAKVRGPGFPVDITYEFIPGQKPPYIPSNADPNNAIYGDAVRPKTTKVTPYATGFRNPYDCTITQRRGQVVCTDNGPNPNNYGNPQIGCKTVGGRLEYLVGPGLKGKEKDELIFATKGGYYGHPNMARVRAKGQCGAEGKWTSPSTHASGVGNAAAVVESSVDGLLEFTSDVYNGVHRGNIFACHYKIGLLRFSAVGKLLDKDPNFPCLDITQGPGGAIYGGDLRQGNVLRVRYPVTPTGPVDVMPSRGRGGIRFVIAGGEFKRQGSTKVKFGSKDATSVKVESSSWITGKVPAVKGLVDVTVVNGGTTYKLEAAFKGL